MIVVASSSSIMRKLFSSSSLSSSSVLLLWLLFLSSWKEEIEKAIIISGVATSTTTTTSMTLVEAVGQELIEPKSVYSTNGILNITLAMERTTISSLSYTVTTRTYNGSIPGPTLRLKPGDKLIVTLLNTLPDQGSYHVHNELSGPDETNLHYHGLHVMGEFPSDDPLMVVYPEGGGNSNRITYETFIPSFHMPGTHWYHPHRHGSTALQVGGGAIGAIIVEDSNNDNNEDEDSSVDNNILPKQVREAREILLVVSQMYFGAMEKIANTSGDKLFTSSNPEGKFLLLNGMVLPVIRIEAQRWIRLRIVYAAWNGGDLGFSIQQGKSNNGCKMYLLAKDGIYINDYPRLINNASLPIPLGGRADVMLRCPNPDSTYTIHSSQSSFSIGTIQTTTMQSQSLLSNSSLPDLMTDSNDDDLVPWVPVYPSYLKDLTNTPFTPNCSCSIRFEPDYFGISGRKFDGRIIHVSTLGAVVERKIYNGEEHPYHQHIYPFQVVSGPGLDLSSSYTKVGDWVDTIRVDGNNNDENNVLVIRYQPTEYQSKVMLHCHKLHHEDQGMMAVEYVGNTPQCQCDVYADPMTYFPGLKSANELQKIINASQQQSLEVNVDSDNSNNPSSSSGASAALISPFSVSFSSSKKKVVNEEWLLWWQNFYMFIISMVTTTATRTTTITTVITLLFAVGEGSFLE